MEKHVEIIYHRHLFASGRRQASRELKGKINEKIESLNVIDFRSLKTVFFGESEKSVSFH